MNRADKAIRALAALTVVALGAVAAVVSFRHALGVVRQNGETGLTAYLSPLTVDGLVLVAALVMLDSARRGQTAPFLAKAALGLGIGATIAVNALHGIEHGVLGAVVAGWPAVALVVTTELLMGMIRRRATTAEPAADAQPSTGTAVPVAVRLDDQPFDPPQPALDPAPQHADAPAETEADTAEPDPVSSGGFNTLSGPSAAGPPPVVDLASAVVSARGAGLSVQRIAEEFGITKYRVNKILDAAASTTEPADTPAPEPQPAGV